MSVKARLLTSLLALGALPSAMAVTAASAATPYPSAQTPNAVDQGALAERSASTPISVTVALRMTDLAAAEALLASLSTPGSAQYHQFLTADQFAARFAPSKSDVAKVVAALSNYGLTVTQTTATTLRATGTPADVERAFAVSLHSYSVPARADVAGYTYYAPQSRGTLPAEVSSLVAAVVGLDSRPNFRPQSIRSSFKQAPKSAAKASSTLSPFGSLTVTDFANLYDVEPLYKKDVTGSGRTLGIMSLANFTPSDVFAYWKSLGLKVNANRLKIVYVDGGPGAASDVSGSLETTLDIEQSGGIAPGANIIAYLAPNTDQAFVDVFAAAIDANKVDTLSISWGGWEWFDNLKNAPVTDPSTGKTVSSTQAVHELLVRAALQGQTVFTAQGDGGGYEANNDLGCLGGYSPSKPDSCSLVISVGYPGSDTAITSAGGTTLPGEQEYCLNSACTPPYYDIDIAHERVWGWDYLEGFCKAIGLSPDACGIFPAGGGGGISITFELPFYQLFTSGTQVSRAGQVFQAGSAIVSEDDIGGYYKLPAYFPGRNVPDVSFNADPETGYVVFYTSNVTGYSEQTFWGGTSFVAPQLNGVAALYGQYTHGRLGLLNPLLYLAQYDKQADALHTIAYGDNWVWSGRNGYSPAAGLGTLDVAKFAEYVLNPF